MTETDLAVTVTVNLPGGIDFITRRGHPAYASLPDLLEAITKLRAVGVELGHEPYLLDIFRHTLVNCYAKAR